MANLSSTAFADCHVVGHLKIEHADGGEVGAVLRTHSGTVFGGMAPAASTLYANPGPLRLGHESDDAVRLLTPVVVDAVVVDDVLVLSRLLLRPVALIVQCLDVVVRCDGSRFALLRRTQFVAGDPGNETRVFDVLHELPDAPDGAIANPLVTEVADQERAHGARVYGGRDRLLQIRGIGFDLGQVLDPPAARPVSPVHVDAVRVPGNAIIVLMPCCSHSAQVSMTRSSVK